MQATKSKAGSLANASNPSPSSSPNQNNPTTVRSRTHSSPPTPTASTPNSLTATQITETNPSPRNPGIPIPITGGPLGSLMRQRSVESRHNPPLAEGRHQLAEGWALLRLGRMVLPEPQGRKLVLLQLLPGGGRNERRWWLRWALIGDLTNCITKLFVSCVRRYTH